MRFNLFPLSVRYAILILNASKQRFVGWNTKLKPSSNVQTQTLSLGIAHFSPFSIWKLESKTRAFGEGVSNL